MLMPGVGICPPSRYTASRPSVNMSRLRRSGTRKMFAKASSSLFMVPSESPALLGFRAYHLRRSASLLDLLHRRLGKMVGFHRNLTRQHASAEHLHAIVHLVDQPRRKHTIDGKRVAVQLLQPAQIDDRKVLLENVLEPALRQAAVQRHLAAFKAALLAESGARVLALAAARRGLSVARAHAAPDPF